LQWKAVAELMSQGASLGPVRIWSILIGGSLGLVVSAFEQSDAALPKVHPSATASDLPGCFLGTMRLCFSWAALVAWLWERRKPAQAGEFLYPVASGIVAGGSLMAVAR
jgi:hypothetical protein